jgi:hypothetical protein
MDISGAALSGLSNAQAAFQSAAARVADPAKSGAEDAVSLSTNAVALIQSKNQFASDIAVAKVADQLTKATIDLVA